MSDSMSLLILGETLDTKYLLQNNGGKSATLPFHIFVAEGRWNEIALPLYLFPHMASMRMKAWSWSANLLKKSNSFEHGQLLFLEWWGKRTFLKCV